MAAAELDADALASLADQLGKAPADVAADVAALQDAERLAQAANGEQAANDEYTRAAKTREKAQATLDAAQDRLDAAKVQMMQAASRVNKAKAAGAELVALRRERPDLFPQEPMTGGIENGSTD